MSIMLALTESAEKERKTNTLKFCTFLHKWSKTSSNFLNLQRVDKVWWNMIDYSFAEVLIQYSYPMGKRDQTLKISH